MNKHIPACYKVYNKVVGQAYLQVEWHPILLLNLPANHCTTTTLPIFIFQLVQQHRIPQFDHLPFVPFFF